MFCIKHINIEMINDGRNIFCPKCKILDRADDRLRAKLG
jgi:hypothetical protein